LLQIIIATQCLLYLIQAKTVLTQIRTPCIYGMMKISTVTCVVVFWAVISTAFGMDRWSALSMLESGNNDYAIGQRGEISRYQILPALWPGGNPQNGQEALAAAKGIMQVRLGRFEKIHGRTATDFEFYVLWNAPWQMDHPSRAVAERAQRFSNLVQRDELARR